MDTETIDQKSTTEGLSSMAQFIRQAPGCIYLKDLQGRYLACSEYLIRELKLKSVDDLIGRTDEELMTFSRAEAIRKNDSRVLRSGHLLEQEETIVLPGQETKVYRVIKTPLKNQSGDIIGIFGNATDITHLKRSERALKEAKEQAEAANIAKSEFIKNMSHDVRTPLHGILGMARLLQMKETDSEKLEYINDQIESIKNLVKLQNEIIEIIQLESYEQPITHDQIHLTDLLDKILLLLRPEAFCKNLQLHYKIDKNIPCVIVGDRRRLSRILLNLVSNAVKFTETGNVDIEVTLQNRIDTDILLSFMVRDTGIGIPKDKFDYVFERFTRLTPAYNGLYKGAGLGLYLVKKTIEELDGSIIIDSTIQKGTTFNCFLPFQVAEQNATQKRLQNLTLKNYKHKPNLLLVEDDLICQTSVKSLAQELGCTLAIANNAQEALQQLENEFDIIFIDIGLPGLDGMALTKKIRNELHIHTPIVITTAHAWDTKAYTDAGMNDLIHKPIRKTALVKIIEKHVHEV